MSVRKNQYGVSGCPSGGENSGQNPLLGNNAKFVSPPPLSGGSRAARFFMQSGVRELAPDSRTARCLRVPVASVGVHWGLEHQRAFYSGLETCGSVWACPVCSSKIAERRRVEIGDAIAVHGFTGGLVALVTFTVRHHQGDDLKRTLSAMLGAHRKLKQGVAFQRFKRRIGFVGTVRALETTHGFSHGWHPHLHELWFLDAGADLVHLEAFLRDRWSSMLPKFDLRPVNAHGLQVDQRADNHQTLNLYLSKLGSWDLAAEMTRAATKKARGKTGRTPAALLWDYVASGDLQAGELFQEFMTVFKGRNHLRWSVGLRDRLLPDVPELSDEELAARYDEQSVLLSLLSRSQWGSVLARDLRAELLDVADSGDDVALLSWMASKGLVGPSGAVSVG